MSAPWADVDVLAVIESHRDQWGDLDKPGLSLEQSRLFALRNPGNDEAVLRQAFNLRASDESLRKAGRVPVISRYRRRASIHRIGGAA
jgi:hypothetical protein